MRILVSGGAGFIGSHLCERLLGTDHQVGIVDDLNDFYSPDLKRENLEAIRKRGPVQFEQYDITDEDRVYCTFETFRPDLVVHLAARAGVQPSLEQPLLYERTNIRGTMVLLEASRRYKTPRFIFASSSSVYGVSNRVPFSEDDPLICPVSPYAVTKLAGEKIAYTYSHLYGISVVCLRLFTVFGPRQRPDLAIRKFIERISAGVPIQVFGNGSSGRDYTYIDDIVAGILASLKFETRFDVFNLGNSHPVDLMTMIRTVEECLGEKAHIQMRPDQPGDVPITHSDISKAGRLLGYSPQCSFRDGVQRTVDHFRQMNAQKEHRAPA